MSIIIFVVVVVVVVVVAKTVVIDGIPTATDKHIGDSWYTIIKDELWRLVQWYSFWLSELVAPYLII